MVVRCGRVEATCIIRLATHTTNILTLTDPVRYKQSNSAGANPTMGAIRRNPEGQSLSSADIRLSQGANHFL